MNEGRRDVFTDWPLDTAKRWGREPLRLAHRWHLDPLFDPGALASLIERYPASHYALVHTSTRGEGERRWREGEIGGASGRDVIATIARGGMWLNLRNVQAVDAHYGVLLNQAHAELAARMPGFVPSALRMGILVSSPDAQVHYHADLPGQALWQISGGKRVHIYPAREPYLTPTALERIALTGVEIGMAYDAAYDRDATLFDLQAGQMLHWPLNSPHRVDNHAVLNISVTTEYWTPQIRRAQMVTMANGVMREHLGLSPTSRALQGPGFWAKAALQAAWRRSPWARRYQRSRRPIDFRLAPDAAGGLVDIAPRPPAA